MRPQGRVLLFSLLLALALPLGVRADDDQGRHHDWHGGYHHDDHEGYHRAPDYGWHGGTHHGWHRGDHHDNHDTDHAWEYRDEDRHGWRPYGSRSYGNGRSWWSSRYYDWWR